MPSFTSKTLAPLTVSKKFSLGLVYCQELQATLRPYWTFVSSGGRGGMGLASKGGSLLRDMSLSIHRTFFLIWLTTLLLFIYVT
jgi:hypothetical protein